MAVLFVGLNNRSQITFIYSPVIFAQSSPVLTSPFDCPKVQHVEVSAHRSEVQR